LGARLAEAGFSVHLVARGPHLAAIRRNGLRVISPNGNVTVRAPATDDPSTIGPVDFVLFAVKLYNFEEATAVIGPLIDRNTVILPVQNGIDCADRLGRALGTGCVLGGVTYIFSRIERPGVIVHSGTAARIALGELDGRRSRRARTLWRILNAAGIEATLSDNIERDIWNKFVFLSSASAISGLSGASVHAMMADRAARALFKAAMEEIVRLGRARGITFDDDLVERHLAFAATLPEESRPSLLADLDAGRETEVDGLFGAVAKLGRQARLVTPIHRTAHAMINLRSQLDRLKRDGARRPLNPSDRAGQQPDVKPGG
jgi:2-dehydropantoate 2-reductase